MSLTPKELRTLRLAAGWTREQLASKIGVTADLIASWESGDVPIACSDAIRSVMRAEHEAEERRREGGS